MNDLSEDEQKARDRVKKTSYIWAAAIGLGTTGLVFWILDSQETGLRLAVAILGGVAVAISTYRKSVTSGRKSFQSTDRTADAYPDEKP